MGRRLIGRRGYLTFIASIVPASAGFAGCTATGPNSADDPETVVEKYYSSIDDGDAEAANAYVHPEEQNSRVSEDKAEKWGKEENEIEARDINLREKGDEEAVVNAMIRQSTQSETYSTRYKFILQRDNDAWKIHGIDTAVDA